MECWLPITYREFYDIPRIFIVQRGDRIFLFDCPFDDVEDEYSKAFKIHLMPNLSTRELAGSWAGLPAKAERFIGEVPISDVRFDPTARQQIEAAALTRFGF